MSKIRLIFAAFVAALFLAACGGGNADEVSQPPSFKTAKEVFDIYQSAPYVFNRSSYDLIEGLDEAGYHIKVVEDGAVLYDKTMPDFGYVAGALADKTRVRLISEYSNSGDSLPSKEYLFIGNQRFSLVFHATRGGQPRQLLVNDISEGGGDWIILYTLDVTSYDETGDVYSYWAVINRHSGDIVEYGYYDEDTQPFSAIATADRKQSLGFAHKTASRLSVRSAQVSR